MMRCLYYRWKLSNSVDGEVRLSKRTRKHLAGCSECWSFFNKSMQLAEQLEQGADLLNINVPAGLDERIIASLESPVNVGRRLNYKLPVRLIASVAACILILILSWVILHNPRQDSPVAGNDPVGEIRKIAGSIRERAEVQYGANPIAMSKVMRNRYPDEISNLANNTGSAVKFLVSCVNVEIAGQPQPPE